MFTYRADSSEHRLIWYWSKPSEATTTVHIMMHYAAVSSLNTMCWIHLSPANGIWILPLYLHQLTPIAVALRPGIPRMVRHISTNGSLVPATPQVWQCNATGRAGVPRENIIGVSIRQEIQRKGVGSFRKATCLLLPPKAKSRATASTILFCSKLLQMSWEQQPTTDFIWIQTIFITICLNT